MASNIIATEGSHIFKYTTTGNVTANSLLVVGSTPMVALETATTGAVISCQVGGAALLVKKAAASTALTPGARAYVIATGGVNKATGLAAAGKLIGYALEAAVTGASTAKVRLITGPSPLETQA